MKKLKILLASTLLLSFLSPLSVVASENLEIFEDQFTEGAALTPEDFDAFIDTLENFVTFIDGEIIFDEYGLQDTFNVDPELVEQIAEAVDNLNDLADDESIIITENGTIFSTDDDDIHLQSNVTKTVWMWWGSREFMSRQTALTQINRLRNASTTSAAIAGISGLLKFPPGAAIGTISAAYTGILANNLSTRRSSTTNRGVILDMTWVLAYTTKVQ